MAATYETSGLAMELTSSSLVCVDSNWDNAVLSICGIKVSSPPTVGLGLFCDTFSSHILGPLTVSLGICCDRFSPFIVGRIVSSSPLTVSLGTCCDRFSPFIVGRIVSSTDG